MSPIEIKLRDAILERHPRLRNATMDVAPRFSADQHMELQPSMSLDDHAVYLFSQAWCIGYKIDLLLWSRGIALGIECDGFEFHDRTPQQAAYDRARDRELLHAGLTLIRFAGTEIYRDAERCAIDVQKSWIAIQKKRNSIIDRVTASLSLRIPVDGAIEEHW